MPTPGPTDRPTLTAAVDAFLFGFAGIAAAWLAYLFLREGFAANWQVLLLVIFWLLVAYLVLPRLHRVLTYVYLPAYFIGRTRTSDGLLGDPVNLAVLGREAQIHEAMTRAGWIRADDVTLASSMRIVTTTLSRRSYAEAPVSPLHLFERPQDFAYQQEVAGSPSKRHHVRFWRCPDDWLLPGGYRVDWLAAGTYDRAVGLSLWTFQITHRISPRIDRERDYIVETLTAANPPVEVTRIDNFSTGYHSRNGGGDRIVTDGDLPVVDVGAIVAPAVATTATSGGSDRCPPPTMFGAAVAGARGVLSLVTGLLLLVDPSRTALLESGAAHGVAVLGSVVFMAVGVLDLALAVATLLGRNWARLWLMVASLVQIVVALVDNLNGGPRPTLGNGLPAIALSILVLLALTSRRSRDYAERSSAAPPATTTVLGVAARPPAVADPTPPD